MRACEVLCIVLLQSFMAACCFKTNSSQNVFESSLSPFVPVSQYSLIHRNSYQLQNVSMRCFGDGFLVPVTRSMNTFECILTHTNLHNTDFLGIHFAIESTDTVGGAFSTLKGSSDKKTFLFQFSVAIPGNFSISFDFCFQNGMLPIHEYRGQHILVTDNTSSQQVSNHGRDLQSQCSNNYFEWIGTGHWLKCSSSLFNSSLSTTSQSCTEWGYIFVPDTIHNPPLCNINVWSNTDLSGVAAQIHSAYHWIVIVGGSIQRGIFFRIVELLLGKELAQNLHVLNKCWGMLDVEYKNMRVSYIDFRGPTHASAPWKTEANNHIECHGPNIVENELEMQNNSVNFMKNLFSDPYKQPTSIVAIMPIAWDGQFSYPTTLRNYLHIPSTWNGNVLLPFYRCHLWRTVDTHLYKLLTLDFRNRFVEKFGRPVHMIDIHDMAIPFLKHMEGGVATVSQHWHDLKHDKEIIPIRVDGIVNDMITHWVLSVDLNGNVFTSGASFTEPKQVSSIRSNTTVVEGLTICQDCPKDFVPFQVKPKYDLQCFHHMPKNEELKPPYLKTITPCPQSCLATNATHMVPISGGKFIEGRHCKIQHEYH